MRTAIMNGWRVLTGVLKKHWRVIQYCFVGLAFLLIGKSLYTSWRELPSLSWKLDYPWFVVSLLLVSVAMLTLAAWWTLSVRLLHEPLGWRQGARIWAVAQLAKYLPGGIWNYVGRVVACDRLGVSRPHTVLSLVIETVLRIEAAIIVFLASLPFWPRSDWSRAELFFIVALLVLGLIALHPLILNRSVNLTLRLLRRQPVDMASVKYGYILGLLVGHVLTVVSTGGAFYLMVVSVHAVPIGAALPMTGMLAISVILGFLNPLTPQGLGTREGLLILLLGYYVPLPIAIVLSLLSRLWLTLAELLGVLIVTLLFRGYHW